MSSGPAPEVVYLAHHSLVLAIPAFAPALIIVGVVLFVVLRDRRAEAADRAKRVEPEQPDDNGATGDRDQQP